MSDVLLGVIVGGAITGIVSIVGQIISNRHASKVAEQKLQHEKRLGKTSSMERRMDDAIKVAIEYARSAWLVRANPGNQALVTEHLKWWLESWRVYGELGLYLERKDAEVYLELIHEMAVIQLNTLISDGSAEKMAEFRKAIEPIREKADKLAGHFRKHFE